MIVGSNNHSKTKLISIISIVTIIILTITLIIINFKSNKTLLRSSMKIELNLSEEEYTNKDVLIYENISSSNFSYIILPDGSKKNNSINIYKVTENGTYTFTAYDKKGAATERSITVTNIDKDSPVGTCTGTYDTKLEMTSLLVDAKDRSGIIKYYVGNSSFAANAIRLTEALSTANVLVFDRAGNQASIPCTLTNVTPIGNYIPRFPNGKEIEEYSINTETLKVWIEEGEKYSYVTHIWAKDPYNQMKLNLAKDFGKAFEKPESIFKRTITEEGLENKNAVAINASGFINSGTGGFNSEVSDNNPDFNYTTFSPIVIKDGVVIRDLSTNYVPFEKQIVVTYGLKSNGILGYYKWEAGINSPYNRYSSKNILDDGVKNTYAFRYVLLYNGKNLMPITTEKNIRQGLCQIDINNFVIITTYTDTRTDGHTYYEMAEYMKKLGCLHGVSLDGGGSTTLMLKNSKDITLVRPNSGRKIADILYFVEE